MELINEAIDLYKEIQIASEAIHEKQIRIAEIAIEVCKIQRGNFRGKRYTLSHFAKDTGIPRTAISRWVDTLKRVVPIIRHDNAPLIGMSKKDWNQAKHIGAQLPSKYKPTDEQMIQSFNHRPRGDRFDKYLRSFEKFTYLLDDIDLHKVNSKTLKAIMEEIDIASDIINDHLTRLHQNTIKLKSEPNKAQICS